MARRDARDRVFSDRSPDDFPAPDDEASVVNVSGHPGSQPVPRGRTMPGQDSPRPGRRRQVEINAESGRALDTKTANLLTGAVTAPEKRHLTVKETVENSDPNVRAAYLDHLFLPPRRDRA